MKKVWIVIGAVIAVLLIAIIAIPSLIDVDHFRPEIEGKLGAALGREVKIGHLQLSIFSGELKANDIAISEDPHFGTAPFVRASVFQTGVEVMPLIFSHSLQIRSLALNEPQVILLKTSAGKWNFSSLGTQQPASRGAPANGGSSTPVSVQKLTINHGKISIGDVGKKPQVYEDVNLTAENITPGAAVPLSLSARTESGGTLNVKGTAGPLNSHDAAQSPFNVKVTLKRVDLNTVAGPSSGISGLMDYDGTAKSDGKVVRSQATANFDKLRVVQGGAPANQAIGLVYASDYDMNRQAGQLTKGEIKTGHSTVSATGTYDKRGDTVLHMKLDAPSIPVEDIQALLPAVGVTLPAGSSLHGGTVATHLAVEGPVDRLVTSGDVNLSNTKLTGFGLADKLAVLRTFTGIKSSPDTVIQTLSSNLHIAPDGIRTDDLKLVVPGLGEIAGAGTISPNGALNFKLVAQLAQTGVGNVLSSLAQRAGVGGAIGKGLPFMVQGTTAAPVFVPDTTAIAREALNGAQAQPNASGRTAITPGNIGNALGGIFGKKKAQ